MRAKHRYVLIDSIGYDANMQDGLISELHRQIGPMDYHSVNPRMLQIKGKLVVRCHLVGLSRLINALTMIKSVNGKETAFYTIKTSGTIRSLLR